MLEDSHEYDFIPATFLGGHQHNKSISDVCQHDGPTKDDNPTAEKDDTLASQISAPSLM